MSCIMVSAICNSCDHVFPNYWVDKDVKGFPSFEGLVCSECGKKNVIQRYWPNTQVSTPLSEDGELKRFEYSYTNSEGKKIQKSIPAHHMKDHLEKKGKRS